MDYYGKKLATCSSDRTVKIFEISGNTQTQVACLRGYVLQRYGIQVFSSVTHGLRLLKNTQQDFFSPTSDYM